MTKDLFIKRLFCFFVGILSMSGLFRDFRDLLAGNGMDSGSLLSLIGVAGAVYYTLHPEKLEWGNLKTATRIYFGALLSIGGGLFCAAYLFFGIKFGYPENWKMICAVSGILAVFGFFMLPFDKGKKEESP